MAEQSNRWSWNITGFEPWKSTTTSPSPEQNDQKPSASRNSTYLVPSHSVASKVEELRDQVKLARNDYLQLRQEASELQEYSNAKLDRVTRYLGVLAEKAHKLDQASLETEARISSVLYEKKKLFNNLLTSKGNIRVFCRARPLFEDEGSSVVEFPDDYTIRVNTGDESLSNSKKEFEFDRVYGPHVGQAELFSDVQPLVQSALDGYNISLFAYGQTHSGKTHTMEGSSYDRGLYARCFEELFDLSNLDTTATSQYTFRVTVCELYNEKIRDLILESGKSLPKLCFGSPEYLIELMQEKVDNPLEFSRVLKAALQSRGNNPLKINVSHLIVTIHIFYNNLITGENSDSKLSLVDLAGSEGLISEDDSGERVTDMLHVMKSLSALGDVLSSLTSKKDVIPYENSVLTKLFADSLGGSSKTLMIVNVCPNSSNLSETLLSLNFSARARNSVLSLGNRDTIKKWRDVANDARKELYEKEKEIQDVKEDGLRLKQTLKDANDQCVLLFKEVQKAWKVSSALQADLKAEHILLTDTYKAEKEENSQLRNQVAHMLQLEQEQSLQIQQRDSTIQSLQTKIGSLEIQLNEALRSSNTRLNVVPETVSGALSNSRTTGDVMDSSAVISKLEEELKKRDALIERLHVENEKLFDKLTEKASLAGSPKLSSPLSRGSVSVEARNGGSTTARARSMDVLPSSLVTDKNDGNFALVKSGSGKVKTTPAGEYLTAALNEFNPDQYEGVAAISDGANKLLMLVLAAVIKAGASREHEILAEIRDAVFSFIRKMEPRRVLDTMLVSRVRILYIRSLLARSPELQSIKVLPVECFLEKANTGPSRSSSRASSPGRSSVQYVDEQIQGFKVNIKPEKKSKFSSVVLKIRGIDEETWRQQVTGGKLREISEEAKSFAIGNKALAALFVHTPAGELQRQIRSWLAEKFDFLSVMGNDTPGGTTGQLELISTAIMDGWMAGLGSAQSPQTDALGQLLFEYSRRVYTSQLQHLKDIASTLATEEAEDATQVAKLRSALESVDHKRRKILQQMRSDVALLTLENGGSPVQNPSTAAEDARLASLISLDRILKQVKDITRLSTVNIIEKSKKRTVLGSLDKLTEQMPSLLEIDHPCAQRCIADARRVVESIPEEDDRIQNLSHSRKPSTDTGSGSGTDVAQWNVLQFNTGNTSSFIIKCGANSNSAHLFSTLNFLSLFKVKLFPSPTQHNTILSVSSLLPERENTTQKTLNSFLLAYKLKPVSLSLSLSICRMPSPKQLLQATVFVSLLVQALCKSTIEPCSNSDSCNALLGYTLYTDLKVSQVASLFQIDPIALLTANAIDISYPDVEHHILPSNLFLKIPISCSCVDGIRKSVATNYKTRPSDTLSSIADSVYGGLVSSDQLREANSIPDPSVLDVGQNLVVPLPCTCFNGSDNSLPAIYLSYVVRPVDSLAAIAARYFTTLTDLMNVNAMGSIAINDGDILAVPIPACASNFPKSASDFGLLVPNGSYAITAGHCVQCSCGPRNLNLYCMPASLAVSCSSMQCRGSNLMLGNVTVQQTSGGCNVTSCNYDGIVNGTIATTLSPSLQPRCPGPQEFPPLVAPPTTVAKDTVFGPAPAPLFDGAGPTSPIPSLVPSSGLPGFSPANGPISGISSGASAACSLVKPLPILTHALVLLLVKLMIPVAL